MKKIIVIVALVLTAVYACKRSTDMIGPSACPSTNFSVITAATFVDSLTGRTDSLDLSKSYAIIKAKFSENISYKLTITGDNGGVYEYNGSGDVVNLHWYGTSTNGKPFSNQEGFSYTLTNLCIKDAFISGRMVIKTIVGLSLVDKSFGVFVSNGENESPKYITGYGPCLTMGDACNASALMTPSSSGYSPSPQGGNYYKYKATCYESSQYYFGGLDYPLTTAGAFSKLPTDPSRVYLNFYAKGQHNSIAQMIFLETVIDTDISRTYNKALVGDQWTLFSIKLSDLGIADPTKLKKLSFNLGTFLVDTSAEVDLDMVIFTVDTPL